MKSNPVAKEFYQREFEDVRCHVDRLLEPLLWQRPRLIFVNSLSDLFHPAVPFTIIATIVGIMAGASRHIFQVLTKRPERAKEFFQWLEEHPDRDKFDCQAFRDKLPGESWQPYLLAHIASQLIDDSQLTHGAVPIRGQWPLPNVWIGVSVETQEYADTRIPALFEIPNVLPWISAEPLLGHIDLENLEPAGSMGPTINAIGSLLGPKLGWIVVGGESGPQARPMPPDAARSLRDQAVRNGIPFFFKQWGEWMPAAEAEAVEGRELKIEMAGSPPCLMAKVGKRQAGSMLDQAAWAQYPEQINDLQ